MVAEIKMSSTRPISLFQGRHFDAGVNNQMNDEFHLAALVSGCWHCACWLTVTAYWDKAIVNVISNACAFPTMTSQNVCCEKGLLEMFSTASPTPKVPVLLENTIPPAGIFGG